MWPRWGRPVADYSTDPLYIANRRVGMSEADARWLADRVRAQGKAQSPKAAPPQIRGGFLQPTRAAAARPGDDLEEVCRLLGLQGFGQRIRAARLSPGAIAATLRPFLARNASAADRDRLGLHLLGLQTGGRNVH